MNEEIVSLTELREILAGTDRAPLSRETISAFVKEGMPKAARGTYPAVKCLRWYVNRLRSMVQQHAAETPDGKTVTLDEVQIRLIAAKAENEEMTAKERRGELIPLGVYEAHLGRLVVNTRSGFLNLPSRMAGRLESQSRYEIKSSLDGEVKKISTALATGASYDAQSGRSFALESGADRVTRTGKRFEPKRLARANERRTR